MTRGERMKRRSRFELLVEIIELCKFPGLPKTYLARNVRTNTGMITDVLFGLVEDKLIRVETRPRSRLGQRRETEFFVRTPDGDSFIRDFTGVRERLTKSGAP